MSIFLGECTDPANLTGSNFAGTNLTEVNLSGSNLSRTDLSKADLSRALLAGVNFESATLSESSFFDAYETNLTFYRNTIMPDGRVEVGPYIHYS